MLQPRDLKVFRDRYSIVDMVRRYRKYLCCQKLAIDRANFGVPSCCLHGVDYCKYDIVALSCPDTSTMFWWDFGYTAVYLGTLVEPIVIRTETLLLSIVFMYLLALSISKCKAFSESVA